MGWGGADVSMLSYKERLPVRGHKMAKNLLGLAGFLPFDILDRHYTDPVNIEG